ncbi:MAG TPA: FAD-binding oxidoreductase [Candidatus Doudnabacteria bacterium]|nr:FAD-binding oxidoreductase [Candidatus Doudnabacteria bacterium]
MLPNPSNRSPWLHYTPRNRSVVKLKQDQQVNIAVVGAGIAGITTAYFLLKHTSLPQIALVEAGRAAHGASGHNGGFLATYFERSFRGLAAEFGLQAAAEAQRDLDTAWDLLDEILLDTQISVPIYKFTGYSAIKTKAQVLGFLEDNHLKAAGGLSIEPLLIAESVSWREQIPAKYDPYFSFAKQSDILDLLQSKDDSYIALLQSRKGASNSALLCELLVEWMLKRYPERLQLFEQTKIDEVILESNQAKLRSQDNHTLIAEKVILCTNGFEHFDITNLAGQELNHKFHYLVRGIVGYMAGYLEERVVAPIEISYLPELQQTAKDIFTEEEYFYLTRRPVEHLKQEHTLVCLGGPETLLEDTAHYQHGDVYPKFALKKFNEFLEKTYQLKKRDHLDYQFLWHGLMGFTPNGVRLVGPEPYNPILYYNLGCNGVGLLPSIFGGRKIARFIAGEELPPSIFDPKR